MRKEELESNLNRIHEWIKSADQKVSIWLAFQGVLVALILPLLMKASFLIVVIQRNYLLIMLIMFLTFYFWSLCKSIAAIIPRLGKAKKDKSLLYFAGIASLNLKNFKESLEKYNETDYREDLIKQIHISALIAVRKHELFRGSILYFIFALSSILLLILGMFLKLIYGC